MSAFFCECVSSGMDFHIYIHTYIGVAHGVMVIAIEHGHGDTSSSLRWGCLHFT